VQFDLYLDALEAMPYGKYLHVGGDEITAIGIDERCKATGKSAFELQMVWLQKVSRFAVEHGRIPIFWDDMPLKYAGLWSLINGDHSEEELDKAWDTEKLDQAIDLFPKECLYMRWYYGDASKPGNKRVVDWYSKKGLNVIGATAAAVGGSPFLPRDNSRIGCIKSFNEIIADNGLAGILATAWDDGSPHAETVWRGFIAQGEYGWNTHGRSLSAFSDDHAQREFGFNPADSLFSFLSRLEKTAFFFDGALVTSGTRNPAWKTKDFTLIDLPDKEKPGVWNETYREKVEKAKTVLAQQDEIEADIAKAKSLALRNRYTLEIYEQTYHLLVYPAHLLVALSDYDQATDDTARKSALETIAEACKNFYIMRKNLEDVYSQTRFMQNPEGFIADTKHHNHLAAKTDNSDWLFLYEMPMVKMVEKWLANL
jgi:hypothetical protein